MYGAPALCWFCDLKGRERWRKTPPSEKGLQDTSVSMAACLCLTWEERQSQIPQQRCAWDSSWRRDPDKLRNRKNRASLSSHLEKQVLADPGSCFSLRSFCHPVLPGLHLQTLFLTGQCPPGCPGDCSPASTRLEVRLSPTPWKSGSISKLECKGPSPWVCRGAGGRAWGVQLPGPFLSLLPALLTHFFFFFWVSHVLFSSVFPFAVASAHDQHHPRE